MIMDYEDEKYITTFKDEQGNVIMNCCENCKYSKGIKDVEGCFKCCKNPPFSDGFPYVKRLDWCGEWIFCED